uniref:Phospholipase B-like n=1 Tax=Ascaris suum TaxID=6253 RepID=F1L6D2_ASCSU
MKAKITANPDDAYWKQVNFTLNQLEGLVAGYDGDPTYAKSPNDLTVHPIYMLQLAGDVEDLEAKFKRPPHLISRAFGSGHCSAFIKLLDSNEDLLFSHVTWTSYSTMLKMQKRYSFKLCKSSNPGHTVTLSGYPGTLASNEDFVLTSAKLAILETTISNYNESSFKFITPTSVLTWIRSQVAHRSANTAVSWAKTFARFDSGTYNNQWSIVDYKKFSPHKPLPSTGLLHVLEQLPGLIKHSDLTHILAAKKYWASYNIPYFSSIFNRSGSWKFVQKFGDWFTYEGNPRALIFARDQSTVADMKTLRKLMRSNDYQHDPLSRCNCTPPYSGENAISCRSDLNPPNGTYPFPALGFRDHGATDMKATNVSLMATQLFEGISGPTYDPLPIFDWNTTPLKENVSHIGQPLQFRFPPVVHRWPSRPNSLHY